MGLFGILNIKKISNLHFKDVRIHSTNDNASVGTISGFLSGGDIEGCSVTGKISSDYQSDSGGLIGHINGGKVLNSYTDVQMAVEGGSDSSVGGLVGTVVSSSIMSSYSRGSVSANNNSTVVGGLVGVMGTKDTKLHYSYSHSEISGGNEKSGGLIGDFSLVVETDRNITISHSYSLGDGFPNDPLFDTYSGISSSVLFWDTDVSGVSTSEITGFTGLTTANMQAACPNGTTTGICALGDGFSFTAGEYPKVKKCTTCDSDSPVFGDVLEGQ